MQLSVKKAEIKSFMCKQYKITTVSVYAYLLAHFCMLSYTDVLLQALWFF